MKAFLEKYKPDKVRVNAEQNLAFLEIGGKRSKVELKSRTAELLTVLKTHDKVISNVELSEIESIYGFNWSEEPEEEQVITKEEDTQQEDIQEEYKPENNADDIQSKLKLIYNNIDNVITKESILEVIITSKGNLIKDGVISPTTVSPDFASIIYEDASARDESSAVGSINSVTIDVKDRHYRISVWKIGDEVSVRFTREFKDLSSLKIVLPTEMKYRYGQLKSGLLITSVNKIINMGHSLPILTELDSNFKKLACTVGDKLTSLGLPNIGTMNDIEYLKNSQYKYIIVEDVGEKKKLLNLLELVYSGKTIIIGFKNDSVYANLISLISLCDDEFTMNKVLMSTMGFIHPIVTLTGGRLSLENSECVTLSSTKAKRILEGDLSKEKFNLFIEKPSKVYSLGNKSTFMSQEDELNELLRQAVKLGASDVHLAVGTSPIFRIQGKLVPVDESIILKPEVLEHIASLFVTTELQKQVLEETYELYMPYSVSGVGRFRVQISTQRGTKWIVIRHTALEIPRAEDMRIPEQVIEAVKRNPKGLVIVTGPTGSGKSTTSAILIDVLKNSGSYAITSLADPIEYIHSHGKGIVTQREIPSDVKSYEQGILSAFRSDPDIIEVAEMRSAKSVEATMRFANSGHLVITTYHTSDVIGTITALKNMVPEDRQKEMVTTIAQQTVCIINQTLVEGIDGKRVPIFEYLIPDRSVRQNIAEEKYTLIESAMKTSGQTNKAIATWADFELVASYQRNEISKEVMYRHLRDKTSMQKAGLTNE